MTSMIMEEYSIVTIQATDLKTQFLNSLNELLNSDRPPIYRDLISYMQIVWSQCQSLLNAFRDVGRISQSKIPRIAAVVQGDANAGADAFSLEHAEKIVNEEFTRLKRALLPTQKLMSSQALADARANAVTAIEEAQNVKKQRDVRILAAAAGACIATNDLPKKLNPLIHGVMESVKVRVQSLQMAYIQANNSTGRREC